MAEKTAQNSYTAKDIHVLEGLEPVRKRPGMYIGSTGNDGLHHLIWEVFDNSLDEAVAGFAKNIIIDLLPNEQVRIFDDGRGIPTDIHPKTKKSALEMATTQLHAGGKFDNTTYKVSSGLHGVGLSVVNALSKWMKAEVRRKPDIFVQEYKQGKPLYPVKKIGKTQETGTTITFEPDPEIFKELGFNWILILNHLRQQAYLTKGVKIVISDQRQVSENFPSHTFYFEGGIVSYVSYLNRREDIIHPNVFYVGKDQDEIFVEVAFQYTKDIQGRELSFANNVHTVEGGMHLTGFRSAITRTFNDYARKNGYLKEKEENLTGEDIREGLTSIVSVKLKDPQFEGQTKSKLGTPNARTAVENVVNVELADWLERNPSDAREIMGKVLLASKARIAAKAARDTVIRKGALEGFTLPGKLADCQSKEPAESELFIVEGESAGGCFSGDTKIALLDGRNISLKELSEEEKRGKKNYCYTIRKDGHIGVAPILNPRITKKNVKVIKITLDNNEEITCTPDHKFMLADRSFKAAENLLATDSLMPLYRKHSKIGGRITIEGYEMVFDKLRNYWIFTHLLSDEYNLENGIYSEKDGIQRHHVDYNKLNNNPENLSRLSRDKHFKVHQEIAGTVLRSPEVLEKLRKIRQTPEYKEKVRKSMLALSPMLSTRAKKQWQNPEYKKFMTKKFLEFYNSNAKYRNKNNELLDNLQKNYWANKENRQKQSETTKRYYIDHPEDKAWRSELSKNQWQDGELKKWRSQKTKEQWTPEFREKRKLAYGQTYLNKALNVLHGIFENDGRIDFEKYESIRRKTNDKNLIRSETILTRFFDDKSELFTEAVKHYNHKIKKIIRLTERADVYDIEVPDTHNFALASGVFVHNSSKQGRDRRTQAILPLKGKILNVEKSRIDRMLASEEIRALVIALGTAIAEEFDLTKLRYHKVVIMTDADVDGAHIRTLLLTLFFRYFRELIDKGFIYIAQPPLYRIQKGTQVQYAYNDDEKEKILAQFIKTSGEKEQAKNSKKNGKDNSGWEVTSLAEKNKSGETASASETGDGETAEVSDGNGEIKVAGVSIQRYKGLGEMNPDQLWETTMNPANRVFLRVTMEDAEESDKIFDILMGSEVLPRKKFIQTHAKNVKNLDI
jgi:DNA gyrase subunit B